MDWNLDEFRKPINLAFLGIAIVSVMVTVITYLWSLHSTSISYHAATIQIVDQKEAVPFSVVDSAGQRVTENVYATNVTVWNSGDLPIDPQNVRSPLTISLTAPVRLIDAKLDYLTTENMSEFRIDGDLTKTGGSVQIGWRYFDPKEGFRLRLIYAAKDMSTVKLNGVILGINKFNDITAPPKKGDLQLIISIVFMIAGMVLEVKTRSRKRLGGWLLAIALVFQVWGLFLTVHPPGPPF